jgi:hypothetical protein
MNRSIPILVLAVLPIFGAFGQAPQPVGPLEDQLIGHWVLEGILGGKQTTHDVDAQWVLNREYVQIHEISREKKADGSPQYEAIIYVAWDERRHEYSCLWLDSTETADFRRLIIGHAKPEPNKIPFILDYSKGETFHNTFSYDKGIDSWEWLLEDHKGDKIDRFGQVRLTRKK